MRRVLIVGVNWLGDAVMTTPAFRALKENNSSLYLAVMTVERTKGIFEDNPYIDEIIIFDERSTHRKVADKFRFIKYLRRKNIDTVFLIHRSFTRAAICWAAGIKTRIGYARLKNNFILSKKVSPLNEDAHRQDKYLGIFQARGVAFRTLTPQIFISEKTRKQAVNMIQALSGGCPLVIGVHVGANWASKRWRPDYFAQLCDRLIQELGAVVIFTGSKKDKALVDEVLGLMCQKPHDICGRTTLKGLAGLIEQMSLFISSDSGPAHLSAAVGTPTLILFGPTSEAQTAPRAKRVLFLRKYNDCKIPCYDQSCKNNVCMSAISVEDAYQAVNKLLSSEEPGD
jgi:lipopolysaccharide heptosyltransferase II